MGKPLRVLNVEDVEDDALLLRRHLARAGYDLTFERVDTAEAMRAALDRQDWDIVIADYVMPQFSAPAALAVLQQRGLDLPFIILSGAIGEETAVAAMRAGAHDYLMKNNLARLVPAIERELQEAASRRERSRAEEALQASEERFRLLVETAQDKIFRYRLIPTPGYEYVSPAAIAIFGYTPEEHYADPDLPFKMVHPDDRPLLEAILHVPAASSGRSFTLRCIRKDGASIWAELRAAPVYDRAGNVVAIQGIARDITERKRAEEMQARRAQYAALRADVGALFAGSGSLRSLFQPCAEAIVRRLNAAFARIWTLNQEENVLELQASAGMSTHLDGAHSRVPVGSCKIGLIAQERKSHLTNQVLSDPRVHDQEWAKREGMVAFAGYPLIVEDRLVGVMAMFARQPLPEDTLDALASVADLLAQAIERKRAEEERVQLLVREQAARQEAEAARQRAASLAEAGVLLAASLDYETTLTQVARWAVSALADWCLIDIVEEDGTVRRVAAAHTDPAKQELVRQLHRYPPDMNKAEGVPKVLRTGQPVLVAEVADSLLEAAAQDREHLRIWRELGSRSSIVAPLQIRGRTIGAVSFVSAQLGRRYGPADLAFAEELARRAALAVDNARLYREAETQRRRLLAIVEQIPVGVIIAAAPDGRLVLWNHAAEALLGHVWAGDHLDDWRSVPALHPDGQLFPFEEWPPVQALATGQHTLGAEMALPGLAGRRMVLLVNAAPIVDEGGRIIAAVTVFQDITQRKTLEQMKDEFLSLAAHELKTPLTAMKGNSQLLLRKAARGRIALGEQDAETLHEIDKRTDYVVGLVNELLDLSRIETGRLALRPEPMDLAALLQEVVREQQRLHPDRSFCLAGADQPVRGSWDRGRLDQVFTNLLDNAVKYNPAGLPITVRLGLGAQPHQVQVAVQDRGIGIPAGDLPHLFERHFRGGNVGLAPGGLGLGLYLSNQIVLQHGGRIWAESAEGHGSTFHVVLPVGWCPSTGGGVAGAVGGS